jgi:hypothetical protein
MASITRSQLNSLLKSLLEAGVNPDLLEFGDKESLKGLTVKLPLKLQVAGGGLFFEVSYEFAPKQNVFCFKAYFFPGSRSANPESESFLAWDYLVPQFANWATRVRSELNEPDPLLLIDQGSMLLGSIPDENRSTADKFSNNDLSTIHRSLTQIRDFLIAEAHPSEQQIASIDERLCYLAESARTQDKKAWAYTAIGVMFTMATALTLSPEQGHKLLGLTSELIKTLFLRLIA